MLIQCSCTTVYQIGSCPYPALGQFLRAAKNSAKFVILQDGIVELMLSIKEGQNLYPIKLRLNEEHQFDVFSLVKYVGV